MDVIPVDPRAFFRSLPYQASTAPPPPPGGESGEAACGCASCVPHLMSFMSTFQRLPARISCFHPHPGPYPSRPRLRPIQPMCVYHVSRPCPLCLVCCAASPTHTQQNANQPKTVNALWPLRLHTCRVHAAAPLPPAQQMLFCEHCTSCSSPCPSPSFRPSQSGRVCNDTRTHAEVGGRHKSQAGTAGRVLGSQPAGAGRPVGAARRMPRGPRSAQPSPWIPGWTPPG